MRRFFRFYSKKSPRGLRYQGNPPISPEGGCSLIIQPRTKGDPMLKHVKTKPTTWFGDLLARLTLNIFQRVILDRFQFCWVKNALTGQIALHEGPSRFWLGAFGTIEDGIKQKTILRDGEWVRIHNPFSHIIKDIALGERARVLQKTDKIIVPTDTRLHLGVDRLIND